MSFLDGEFAGQQIFQKIYRFCDRNLERSTKPKTIVAIGYIRVAVAPILKVFAIAFCTDVQCKVLKVPCG